MIRAKLSEMSDQLCESLICWYLVKVGSEIAEEFKVRFSPSENSLDLETVLRAFTWENLVRATVYNHLEITAPRTARAFRKRLSFQGVSHRFGRFVEILLLAWTRTNEKTSSELEEVGAKSTTKKVSGRERITRSGGNTVSSGRKLGVRPQRFSPEEDARIREALGAGRHYAELAAELGRSC